MSHANEDTLRTAYDAFSKGDVETVMGLLTDDIEYHIPGRSPLAGSYTGKNEILGLFGKLMELSGGTFRVEVQDILANDEHGVTLTIERGQRDGKTLENRAVHVWDIRDGKCARFRGYNEETWDDFWS
jgi:ketosteroid isomerase-like protein